MKKNLFVAIFAVISGLLSCTNEDVTAVTPETETVTFNIQPDAKASTRAAAPTVDGKDTRYIVELWKADKSERIERHVQLNDPSFSLLLDRAVSYYVAVWVDYVTDVDDTTPEPDDYYYVTTNLKSVTLNTTDQTPGAFDTRVYQMSNIAARDAFTGVFSFASGQPYPTSLQVTRPLARINVIATDAGLWKNRTETQGKDIVIRITNPGYYTYNVLEQKSVATGINVEFDNTITPATYGTYADGVSQTVLSGLYFADTNTTDVLLSTRTFTLHWKVGTNDELALPAITSLPYKRNYNTNITGGLIYNSVNFEIDTNSNYEATPINTNL